MGFSVFALGGAGAIGGELCRALLAAPDLDRLTIAELDLGRARSLAENLADARVQAVRADVRDVVATARAARGHDVVMNALFWEHFDDALTVACLAGANYADLLSHPTPQQRARAADAGITAVPGLGASPGIGNVLGRKACEEFDEPVSLEIACTSFRSIAPSPGLLDTLVELASPGLPERGYYFHGRFVPSQPMEGSKLVDFGPPVGTQMVYYINHSEVTSFPAHFPSLKFVAVRGTYRPSLVRDMRVLASYGLLDDVAVPTTGGTASIRRLVRDRIWEVLGGHDDADSHHLYLHVEAAGTRRGRFGRVTWRAAHPLSWGPAAIGRMTGIGAAVGVVLIGRQGRAKAGVCDPEEYFDPGTFLAELTGHPGISVTHEIAWDPAPGGGSRAEPGRPPRTAPTA